MTIWEARNLAVKELQRTQNESNAKSVFATPTLDIDCLLGYVLGYDRSKLLSRNQDFLDTDDEKTFFELVEKRCTGIPIAYLVNKKEFFGYDFFVNESVLIPKPDTELLVEHTIEIIEKQFASFSKPFMIADICTGSGCIALSILSSLLEKSNHCAETIVLETHCSDISTLALDVAKKNKDLLIPPNKHEFVKFFQGDLTDALPKNTLYDLIVSNPPYVPNKIVDELLLDGRNEPRIALDGDIGSSESNDGLFIIKNLIPQAFSRLQSNGYFLIETGEYNALETSLIMKEHGFIDVKTFKDLAGLPRLTIGRKP